MNQQVLLAIINLVAQVGLDAAIVIMQGLGAAKTIDDAIAALQAAQAKTAQDYLDEAKKALQPPPAPPTP